MTTVCLAMIVKNEAHILKRCLNSVLPLVDYVYVADTGSTDDTQKIANDWMQENHMPGCVESHAWANFGHNRTEAICRSKKLFNAHYTLVMDADEILQFENPSKVSELKNSLCNDLHNIICKYGQIEYLRPILFSNQKNFVYKGHLHEFLECQDVIESCSILQGVHNVPIQDSSRNKDANKYKNDAALLERAIALNTDASLSQRYHFYLAQSYKDCNNVHMAILNYEKVLNLQGYVQEKYCACLYLGRLYLDLGQKEKCIFYLLKAIEYDKSRIETVAMVTSVLRELNLHNMVCMLHDMFKGYDKTNNDVLFKEVELYKNHVEFNFSVSAYYCGRKEEGKKVLKKILADADTSCILMEQAKKNSVFYDL